MRRLIASVVIATFAVPMGSSMVALALSPIATEFGVSLGQVAWVVSSYLIGMALFQVVAGRLTDLFGSRAVFWGGSLLFGLGSLACAAAPGFVGLLGGRVLQALGGAVLVPAGSVVLKEAVPAERHGRAFGLVGATAGLGAAFGPPLGGLLLGWLGWRVQFGASAALTVLGLLLAGLPVLERRPASGAGARLIDWRLFESRAYRVAVTSVFLNNFMLYSVLLTVPLYLRARWALPDSRVGLVLFAFAGSATLTMALGGWLTDRAGRRLPVLAGALLATAGGLVAVVAGDSLGVLTLGVGMAGLGLGLGAAAMQAAALAAGEAHGAGVAAGTFSTVSYLGSILATQVLAGSGAGFAVQAACFLACGLAGAPVALGLPGPATENREPR